MRLIVLFLSILVIAGCGSGKRVLSKREFAEVYLDSLSKRYPNGHFRLNPDVTISMKKDSLEGLSYVDNAYKAYTAEPDSIKSIIIRYLASTTDFFLAQQEETTIDNIIPVIKPATFFDEVKLPGKDNKAEMVVDKYNDELIIAYAIDSKNSIQYLTEKEFEKLAVSRDTLKAVALRNFVRVLPDIQQRGGDGLYMITAGGNYEASLILLSFIWDKKSMPVDGEYIVAIPNRDILLVTGSKNKEGIGKLRDMITKSYGTGNYQVSESLYKWTGKKFVKYP